MDTFGDVALSGTAKELLTKLRTKDITLEQLLRECAYWAIKDGFDELSPFQLPTAPTSQAFLEYEGLPPERRAKVDPDFFYRNYEINEYFKQVGYVRNKNKGIMEWLKEILSYLTQEEPLRERVEARLLDFQAFFNDNPVIVEKLKSVFRGQEVKQKNYRPYSKIGEVFAQ